MSSIENIVSRQKAFFRTDKTKSVDFRIAMLRKLEMAIRQNEDAILEALRLDLGKSRAEGYMTEIGIVYAELHEAIKHVKAWARPKRVRGTLSTFPAANYIYSEPYGVVLIMAPWNYPFNLSMAPLVGAIAAGNCAVVKCSRTSSYTSSLIRGIINTVFAGHYIYCIDPAADYEEVLNQKYDYIFFTGSPAVGRHVMEVAGRNLIPVSLELGGKSPCIIDETADLKLAAKRIAWGKFMNAGQTCVAIDYVLVHQSVKDAFIKALQDEIDRRYPDAVNDDAYPRIISRHHYDRLMALIGTEKNVIGGQRNDAAIKIGPTILPEADFDHEIMAEEIFGPLLPVISYEHLKDAVSQIKDRDKPLACYIFTNRKQTADRLIRTLSYGGGCVNDVILQIANHHMPFGGVGLSGIGGYHGRYSFETFSHRKGMVMAKTYLDMPFRYAPFTEGKLKLFRKIM